MDWAAWCVVRPVEVLLEEHGQQLCCGGDGSNDIYLIGTAWNAGLQRTRKVGMGVPTSICDVAEQRLAGLPEVGE